MKGQDCFPDPGYYLCSKKQLLLVSCERKTCYQQGVHHSLQYPGQDNSKQQTSNINKMHENCKQQPEQGSIACKGLGRWITKVRRNSKHQITGAGRTSTCTISVSVMNILCREGIGSCVSQTQPGLLVFYRQLATCVHVGSLPSYLFPLSQLESIVVLQ